MTEASSALCTQGRETSSRRGKRGGVRTKSFLNCRSVTQTIASQLQNMKLLTAMILYSESYQTNHRSGFFVYDYSHTLCTVTSPIRVLFAFTKTPGLGIKMPSVSACLDEAKHMLIWGLNTCSTHYHSNVTEFTKLLF